jgi:acyl-CoA reductase-like NAD-dependent aldehyde dehydrogenase
MHEVKDVLYVDGRWAPASDGRSRPVVDPATEEAVTTVAEASASDIERLTG